MERDRDKDKDRDRETRPTEREIARLAAELIHKHWQLARARAPVGQTAQATALGNLTAARKRVIL